MTEQQSTTHS